jgi:hypothetical protein
MPDIDCTRMKARRKHRGEEYVDCYVVLKESEFANFHGIDPASLFILAGRCHNPNCRTNPPGYTSGEIDSLESIPGILKCLQIRAQVGNRVLVMGGEPATIPLQFQQQASTYYKTT